jgi:malonate-semialdehyde dehydrogenase (acetylating)/methylmalonate-semialdehyde dehydrogenase
VIDTRTSGRDLLSTELSLGTVQHHIGGSSTAGSSTRTGEIWDPSRGTVQGRVLLGDQRDVDLAVAAARAAFADWGQTSLAARTRVLFAFRNLLHDHVDELARVIAAEHGKVVDDARGEISRGLEVVEFACGLAQLSKGEFSEQVSSDVDAFSVRQPLGVCAGITPFNFPAMVPLWMYPLAIATGNTFVLKPSERDPSASSFVAELWRRAGLPAGVFNVVHGDRVTVDALLEHPDVAAVSFVGSTPVARHVHERASRAGKRVQALGGAKNHAVVAEDADLEYAATQLTAAGYGSAGQRCMAISVVVALEGVADALVAKLAERARSLRVGPSLDPDSEMGPVVTRDALQRIGGYIQQGVADGAELVVDGRDPAVDGDGFFLGPTLFDRVRTDMSIYTDEIFGPVLVVVRVGSLDEAIDLINSGSFANGTAIFTAGGRAARRFQREVQVGMIGINVPIPVPMAYYSFGGWKDSLFGEHHIHGAEGVRFYTRAKAVTARWPGQDTSRTHDLQFPTSR